MGGVDHVRCCNNFLSPLNALIPRATQGGFPLTWQGTHSTTGVRGQNDRGCFHFIESPMTPLSPMNTNKDFLWWGLSISWAQAYPLLRLCCITSTREAGEESKRSRTPGVSQELEHSLTKGSPTAWVQLVTWCHGSLQPVAQNVSSNPSL